ncbi:MAG TPA: hypothetical protein VK986_00820 [Tepidisphaeraceae bacterium]|nr:hypothetical protein [Tepidisphaeraceae bacterium]
MKRLLTTAVAALTLGSAALMTPSASADWRYGNRYDNRYDHRHDHYRPVYQSFDYNVSMNDVPWRVRETLRDVVRGRGIEAVQYVSRDGKLFYRFRVDRRYGPDLNYRISPDGRLLSVEQAGW